MRDGPQVWRLRRRRPSDVGSQAWDTQFDNLERSLCRAYALLRRSRLFVVHLTVKRLLYFGTLSPQIKRQS